MGVAAAILIAATGTAVASHNARQDQKGILHNKEKKAKAAVDKKEAEFKAKEDEEKRKQKAFEENRQRISRQRARTPGKGGTLLTGPVGLKSNSKTSGKTLLGQ